MAEGVTGEVGGTTDPSARLRVGVDLVSVADIAEAVALHGDRYLRRVFTGHEIESCQSDQGIRFESLAARFAAKEAAVKALQPSDGGPSWTDIEIRRAGNGACSVALHGAAAEYAAAAGIDHLAVSMSHEGQVAVAVVAAWAR